MSRRNLQQILQPQRILHEPRVRLNNSFERIILINVQRNRMRRDQEGHALGTRRRGQTTLVVIELRRGYRVNEAGEI